MKNIIGKKEAKVIDVRDEWEYQEGHINDAVNIPLHELPAHINQLKKLEGPLILYCRSGNRSATAVNLLRQAGINNVFNGGSMSEMQKIVLN
ncbi:MAG TPA: rhodanese-like domain-containing protein [Chitinophagaceae bacterium]|nr:rhodanese-like domain-containing protein [Chitinophagaceae bacterium]